MNGREVNKEPLIVNSGKAMMLSSHLSDGVYVLELRNSSGQIARKKLIITK